MIWAGPKTYKSVGLSHKLSNEPQLELINVDTRVTVLNVFELFSTQ